MAIKQNTAYSTEYYPIASPAIIEDDDYSEGNASNKEKIDITKEVPEQDKYLVQPAGVGGAVLGTIFFGPILGALIGFSAAYGVRKQNGAGNVARALGELTASVQGKTAEIEEKHHFGENTADAINNFCDDDRERSIPYKTREFLVTTWLSLVNFTKERQLLEKGVEGTGKGLEAIGKAFERLSEKQPKSPRTTEDLVFVASNEVPVEISNDARYTELVQVTTN